MRIGFAKVRFRHDGINIAVTFRAHFIRESPFVWRVIKIIRHIPNGFLDFILDAVFMAVNTIYRRALRQRGLDLWLPFQPGTPAARSMQMEHRAQTFGYTAGKNAAKESV